MAVFLYRKLRHRRPQRVPGKCPPLVMALSEKYGGCEVLRAFLEDTLPAFSWKGRRAR